MKNVLSKMIEQLSDEDKQVFSQLAEKLNQVDGNISKLSEQELKVISKMEEKYADKLSQFESELSVNEEPISNNFVNSQSTIENANGLLESGFASHVRQILARDLKSQFPNEEDAVKFAFQNKWLPEDFKDPKKSLSIFENYQQDICEANQWREEVVGVESDKGLAIGLTWFMVIFQLNQRLN